MVWMAVILVVMLGVAAMTVDLIHAYVEAQHAQNAADSASLAGVVSLPNDQPAANAAALGARGQTATRTSLAIRPRP